MKGRLSRRWGEVERDSGHESDCIEDVHLYPDTNHFTVFPSVKAGIFLGSEKTIVFEDCNMRVNRVYQDVVC